MATLEIGLCVGCHEYFTSLEASFLQNWHILCHVTLPQTKFPGKFSFLFLFLIELLPDSLETEYRLTGDVIWSLHDC